MQSSSGSGGLLHIVVVQAELTRDVETFGKQDPYVKITYLGTPYKTRVHNDGGKRPVWNQAFDFQIGSISDEIHLEVKDDDVIGAEMIGQATIKASSLCINNGVRDWFTVEYKNKSAGKILLDTKFTPTNKPAATMQPMGMPPPGMPYGVSGY